MGRSYPKEEWRQIVADWVVSGLTQKEYAALRGDVNAWNITQWSCRLYREGDLDLFVLSPMLSVCPAMARTVRYHAEPQLGGYLREVYLEIYRARERRDAMEPLSPHEVRLFFSVESVLTEPAHSGGVSICDLERIAETRPSAGVSGTACLRPAVLAALKTGFHERDPFFEWAAANEGLLRRMRKSGPVIATALEGDARERMRIVRCKGTHFDICRFDCTTPFCVDLLDGFLASDRCPKSGYVVFFCGHFAESIGFSPESIADFTPETFGRQLEWFRGSSANAQALIGLQRLCRGFYLYIADLLPEDQTAFTFETGLPLRALSLRTIARHWLDGYRCVLHEPLDPVPAYPKMIAYPNADEALKSSVNEGQPFLLDCSMEDREVEAVLMRWAWLEETTRSTTDRLALVKLLATAVSQGERSEDGAYVVAPSMVRGVLAEAGGKSPKTRRKLKFILRGFLERCEEEGFDVQPGCWLLLETTRAERDRSSGKEVDAVSEEHLAMLADRLEEKAGESLDDELAYIAFIVQALTDLRSSEVCGLRTVDIDVGPRNGVKAVRVCRKTSGKAFQKVQVTEEIHRLLQVAARITEPVRREAPEEIAHYLFIYEDAAGNPLVMSQVAYAHRIELACRELEIPKVAPTNIRKRYMTTGIQEGLKNGISRIALLDITGHADLRSDSFYLRPDIMSPETRAYLEGAFLVDFGGCCEVRGEVLPDSELPEEVRSLVEGGAGICRSASCNVAGTVPCPMCAGFATSPRYIPEMLDAIATIDEKMKRASPHDREHLLDAKCAYLAYLGKMIDKEKEEQHG